jgi:hypothetical protein
VDSTAVGGVIGASVTPCAQRAFAVVSRPSRASGSCRLICATARRAVAQIANRDGGRLSEPREESAIAESAAMAATAINSFRPWTRQNRRNVIST